MKPDQPGTPWENFVNSEGRTQEATSSEKLATKGTEKRKFGMGATKSGE